MKVRDATPGQILYARGKIPKSYIRNLGEEELRTAQEAGFVPAFMMPNWLGEVARPTGLAGPMGLGPGSYLCTKLTAMLYIGKVQTPSPIGGLKTHHVFLYDGKKYALQGYDFRDLESTNSL